MRKTAYLIITFVICSILKLQYIWAGFVPAMLLISRLNFQSSVLWEIPLAILSFNVLEIAFADDLKLLLYILVLCASALVAFAFPKRLPVFFLIAIFSVAIKNIYSAAAVWATLWWSLRTILCHFTIKQQNLQEHKL